MIEQKPEMANSLCVKLHSSSAGCFVAGEVKTDQICVSARQSDRGGYILFTLFTWTGFTHLLVCLFWSAAQGDAQPLNLYYPSLAITANVSIICIQLTFK